MSYTMLIGEIIFRITEEEMLAKKTANRYTTPNGADFIRCVGADTTCAGVEERQLFYTAVVLFSICIIPCVHTHINMAFFTNICLFYCAIYVYAHIFIFGHTSAILIGR